MSLRCYNVQKTWKVLYFRLNDRVMVLTGPRNLWSARGAAVADLYCSARHFSIMRFDRRDQNRGANGQEHEALNKHRHTYHDKCVYDPNVLLLKGNLCFILGK